MTCMRSSPFILAAAGLVGLAASFAHAQWASDPAVNTPVAVVTNDQGTNISRPTPDGGMWVSYFDNSAGAGYKPTLQRFTACGDPVFPTPIVVDPTRTSGTIFTYDMRVDAAGNAVIVYDNTFLYVHKINFDGTFAWAAPVQFPGSSGLLGAKVAIAADGTIVAAVGKNQTAAPATNAILFQRFNADGTLGPAWSQAETGFAHVPSDMLPTGNAGDVILLYVRHSGTNQATTARGLRIQRYDSAGLGVWNAGAFVTVFASTNVAPTHSMTTGYFPVLVADGSGGAVVAWYENGTTRNAYLQHYDASGTPRFPAGGLPISTNPQTVEQRLSASVAYEPSSESYFFAYERANSGGTIYGLAAQRINWDAVNGGVLQWGAGTGTTIIPISATSFHSSFVDARRTASGDGIVTWIQYQGANSPMQIQATRIDSAGNPVWGTPIVVASSNATNKSRLSVTQPVGRQAVIAVWQDGPAGNADMLGQFIKFDGTLGTCPADFGCDGVVGVQDIFDFLAAWFAQLDSADFNGVNGVTVQDIFDFLAAWFAGC